MSTTIPTVDPDAHKKGSVDLTVDGYVQFFQITLKDGDGNPSVLYLTPEIDRNWQGIPWEGYPITVSGDFDDSSGEQSKPKLTVVNPEGVFSKYASAGWTDSAEVIRYRVLLDHVNANVNSFLKKTWRISKILALNKTIATFELRGALDGQQFKIPARTFSPPEYKQVSLS